jgi:hypothetical protein
MALTNLRPFVSVDHPIHLLVMRIEGEMYLSPHCRALLGYETKIINGKKHYAFEVFFVGASNPYYYVTTVYVSVDAKSFFANEGQ